MSGTLAELRAALAELERVTGASAPITFRLDNTLAPDDATAEELAAVETLNTDAQEKLDAALGEAPEGVARVVIRRVFVWHRAGTPVPSELPLELDELSAADGPSNSQEPRSGDFALPPMPETAQAPAEPLEPVAAPQAATEPPPLWSAERAASEAAALGNPAPAAEAPALHIGGAEATRRRAEDEARNAALAGSAVRIRLNDL